MTLEELERLQDVFEIAQTLAERIEELEDEIIDVSHAKPEDLWVVCKRKINLTQGVWKKTFGEQLRAWVLEVLHSQLADTRLQLSRIEVPK